MRIVTDSAVDLPEEMFEQYGVERMPLLINFGTESLRSGIDIQPAEFYRRLAADPDHLPTTSQPSVGEFVDLFRRVGQVDKDIVSVHISSGLSGTFNSGHCLAACAAELMVPLKPDDTCNDTMSLSACPTRRYNSTNSPTGGLLGFQVIFQCKKWKGSVGAGDIRDFRGAMVGRADKGLFITTGTFTKDAMKEATRDAATPIDLI